MIIGNNGLNAELKQQENAPMYFYTNDASASIKERMKITYGNGWNGSTVSNVTKVNISYGPGSYSPIALNVAMLNLGESVPSGGGQRSWMDVGTFGCLSTDNMYTGLKYEGTDQADAVVGWGDNINPPDGADNLRFIVSTATGAGGGTASTFEGLEVARMAPNGRVGIGNFSTAGSGSGQQPVRRLEIYDEHLLNSGTAVPQLRLTYDPSITTPVNTDLQTTSSGNLYIHPTNATVNHFVGINDPTPGNSVEITSTAGLSPQPAGLRFTNLTSASTSASSGTYTHFLAVDGNGDVVLGDVPSAGGGVSACAVGGGMATDYITKWTAANTICKTAGIWEDPSGANNVGIGTTSPGQKLGVNGNVNILNASTFNGYFIGGNPFMSVAGSGTNVVIGQSAGNAAIGGTYALGSCTFLGWQTGLVNAAVGADNTFLGSTAGIATTTGPENTFAGYSAGSENVIGFNNTYLGSWAGKYNNGDNNVMLGYTAGSSGSTQTGDMNTFVGVGTGSTNTGSSNTALGYGANVSASLSFATAIGSNASVATSSTVALGRSGDQVVVAGSTPNGTDALTVYGSAAKNSGGNTWATFSDLQLKKDITPFNDGLNVISQLHTVNYKYKNYKFLDSTTAQIGIIAQDLINVAPYTIDTVMVNLDTNTAVLSPVLMFNSNGIFWAMVNAVKELNSLNQALTARVDQMQAQLDNCCNAGSRHVNPDGGEPGSGIDVELKNSMSIILNQNVPNPFSEQCTITFFIPDDVNKAQIYFYDNRGVILKTVEINEKGAGQINVFAADLSSGSYTYSLIADGKLIETKKMVKTN